MKAFSDLEQSKKLAEILPLESADMYYPWYIEEDGDNIKSGHRISIPSVGNFIYRVNRMILPCWSLAALIGVIPKTINFGYENDSTFVLKPLTNGKYLADYYEISYVKDNPIDACYNMILKLHELNLL